MITLGRIIHRREIITSALSVGKGGTSREKAPGCRSGHRFAPRRAMRRGIFRLSLLFGTKPRDLLRLEWAGRLHGREEFCL